MGSDAYAERRAMDLHITHGVRRWAIAVLSLFFALCCLATVASAQTLCSEPIMPTCVELDLTYDDVGATARCEDDLRRFSDDLDNYVACIDRRARELEELHDRAHEVFLCRSEGKVDCL